MRVAAWVIAASLVDPAAAAAGSEVQPAPARDTIAQIQVHGNVLTPEADIVGLAGIAVGLPFEADTINAVSERLRRSGRFARVEVLKRFASIADPSQITLVILVDEGPVRIERTGNPDAPTRVVRSGGRRLLFLPVLRFEEGYGFSYGVRLAHPDPIGQRSRVSFPVTWGAERLAAARIEKRLDRGAFRRWDSGASISRRTHPFYDVPDTRVRVQGRGDVRLPGPVRADIGGGWERVTFDGQPDRVVRLEAGVTLDTRIDPVVARNAVYARAAWEHLATRSAGGIEVLTLDVSGYVGFVGETFLVVRAQRDDANRSRPLFLKPMLGGSDVVRGFRAGSAVGDTLTAGSLELRLPLTSRRWGKLGLAVFADAATVYDEGGRLVDQRFERGVGAGVWFSAAIFRFNLAVAHGLGRSTRVHVGTNLIF
jgi:outer membrane protein assembly factor BamA